MLLSAISIYHVIALISVVIILFFLLFRVFFPDFLHIIAKHLFELPQLIFTLEHPKSLQMKNLKFFSYLLIVVSTSFFTRCTPENIDYRSTAREFISAGQWSIEYYNDGQDKTAQFHDMRFRFLGDGTVTANASNISVLGNWSIVRDVNRNEVLGININEQHFPALADQWTVTSAQAELLVMKDGGRELRLRKL